MTAKVGFVRPVWSDQSPAIQMPKWQMALFAWLPLAGEASASSDRAEMVNAQNSADTHATSYVVWPTMAQFMRRTGSFKLQDRCLF
jgi:hypothetical protein